MAQAIDVFRYLDYRAYLRDYYAARKAEGRGFSFRAFSRRIGLRSPNYLKLVMDGERNLTSEMGARFGVGCGLQGEALAYFLDLVGLNQASSAEERNAVYARLASFRRYRSIHRLEMAQAAYHSNWYLPAIRELAARRDFKGEPAWIAARLRPSVPRAEVARALEVLVELGLLVKGPRGKLVQGEALLTTGAETRGLHIANYHRAMLDRAKESIDTIPAAERDISSLTLCVSADGLKDLKERVQRFRRELLERSSLEEDPREVVQVNFQLFPLTQAEKQADRRPGEVRS